jgi:hypothetical protein
MFLILIILKDRNERVNTNKLNIEHNIQEKEFENKRVQQREAKKQLVSSSITSNGFFTNSSNKFYYETFFKDRKIYIMDAKLSGNIGRYFNHSCSPNVFVQNVFIDSYDLRFPYIAFFARNSIKAGTELCWDYNYVIDSVKGWLKIK